MFGSSSSDRGPVHTHTSSETRRRCAPPPPSPGAVHLLHQLLVHHPPADVLVLCREHSNFSCNVNMHRWTAPSRRCTITAAGGLLGMRGAGRAAVSFTARAAGSPNIIRRRLCSAPLSIVVIWSAALPSVLLRMPRESNINERTSSRSSSSYLPAAAACPQ